MIALTGYLYVQPTDVAAFAAAIEAVAPPTRAEPGCLFYGVALDDAQAGRFLVAQRWADRAALAAHLHTPATLAFLAIWADRIKAELAQTAT